jgi:aminomethyltransferase
MALQTALFGEHQRLNARITPFGGWDMPLHYGSQLNEHLAVRAHAGQFDVSHMRPVDISGADAQAFLRYLLANDVAHLQTPGAALYSCMLNPQGGIVDDLIVYFMTPTDYRVVVNAGTATSDIAWMQQQQADFNVTITPRTDLAMLAIQGPASREIVAAQLPSSLGVAAFALPPFHALQDNDWFVARTGYTGEDGFEIMLPIPQVVDFWRCLQESGIQPCGLGARDTLRLEAGLNLYGQEMDTTVTPLETGVAWTVAWSPDDRRFIGRDALEKQRQTPIAYQRQGLVLLESGGVLRPQQRVLTSDGQEAGLITSGTFAPTLQRSIALARVNLQLNEDCQVVIRGKQLKARIVKPPFVRFGKSCLTI